MLSAYSGWVGGIRTHGMTESKSVALPLGDNPIFNLSGLFKPNFTNANFYNLANLLGKRRP